jgi:magnesium transporter
MPILLKRFGADPATASSIFMTTITDAVSTGPLSAAGALLLLR